MELEALAERDEEFAVRAEGKPRAKMVLAADFWLLPEDDLDIFETAARLSRGNLPFCSVSSKGNLVGF